MVKHILKDGTVKEDITGHKVKKKDVPEYYDLVNRVREGKHEKRS